MDGETGSYYLRARYYDPNLGRFLNEDPARDGLNWYTYCGGNPVAFVDPWGLALVGLSEYAKGFGASVTWDGDTGYATVTYGGHILQVQSTAENNIDGRIYIDDSILNSEFGWGTTTILGLGSVRLTNVKNDVNMSLGGGWSYRYEVGDPNNPGNSTHMHLFQSNGKQSYSQNEDGSPKDPPKGGSGPPNSIMKKLKSQTGWDWKQKDINHLNRIQVTSDPAGYHFIQYPNGRSVTIYRPASYYSLPYSPSLQELREYYFGPTSIDLSGGSTITGPSSLLLPLPNPGAIPIPAPMPIPAFP